MKNKKNVFLYIIIGSLFVGAYFMFTRYQQHCFVPNTRYIGNGAQFNNMNICRGEYYLKIEDVEPNNKLEMTTFLFDNHGSYTEDEKKVVKKGDEIIVDKSQDIMYQITDLSNEETKITLKISKR